MAEKRSDLQLELQLHPTGEGSLLRGREEELTSVQDVLLAREASFGIANAQIIRGPQVRPLKVDSQAVYAELPREVARERVAEREVLEPEVAAVLKKAGGLPRAVVSYIAKYSPRNIRLIAGLLPAIKRMFRGLYLAI
jgi:hypothetical protein